MFNPTQLVIDAFVSELKDRYLRIYGLLEPEFPNVIAFCGRMALESIANSDAPYHDVNHTIMVTLVGQEILKGKHLSEGGVSPADWLHFVISLLGQVIGYVHGVCHGDSVAGGLAGVVQQHGIFAVGGDGGVDGHDAGLDGGYVGNAHGSAGGRGFDDELAKLGRVMRLRADEAEDELVIGFVEAG